MPLPSSGPLGIGAIRTELGTSNGSLRYLSGLAGFSTPDAMSEFYGYAAGGANIIMDLNIDNFLPGSNYVSVGVDGDYYYSYDNAYEYFNISVPPNTTIPIEIEAYTSNSYVLQVEAYDDYILYEYDSGFSMVLLTFNYTTPSVDFSLYTAAY